MFGLTIVLVPGNHQVGQYLTSKSVCKHVWLLLDSHVLMSGHTQDVGDSVKNCQLEMWVGSQQHRR